MADRYPDTDYRRSEQHVATERVDDTVIDSPATRNAGVYRLQQAIYLLFGVIEVLIAIRFALRALAANPEAPFVSAMYTITSPFIAPFVGMFGTPQFGGSVFEPHSAVAIIVYALLAWLLGSLIWLLMADTRSDVKTASRTVHSEHEHEHDQDLAA